MTEYVGIDWPAVPEEIIAELEKYNFICDTYYIMISFAGCT